MPCNATLKGKRRQYDIIHKFKYWTNVQIYNIQNTEWYEVQKLRTSNIYMKIYLAYVEHVHKNTHSI